MPASCMTTNEMQSTKPPFLVLMSLVKLERTVEQVGCEMSHFHIVRGEERLDDFGGLSPVTSGQRVADFQEDHIRGEQGLTVIEIRESRRALMVLVALVDERDHIERVNEGLDHRQDVFL